MGDLSSGSMIKTAESAPACVHSDGKCDCVNVVSKHSSVEMWACGPTGGEERFMHDAETGLISTPAGKCLTPGRFSPPAPPSPPSPHCATFEVSGSTTAGHNGRYSRVDGVSRDGVGVWHHDDAHEIYRYGGVWRIANYG